MPRRIEVIIFLTFLSAILCHCISPGIVEAKEPVSSGVQTSSQVDTVPFQKDKLPVIGTEAIDKVGEKVGDTIDKAGSGASAKFGNWVKREAFMGITWLKLMSCASLLVLVIAIVGIFRVWVVRVKSRLEVREGRALWAVACLDAILGPVSLLVMVYGVYGALVPVLVHFQEPDGSNMLRRVAAPAADLGGMIALIWLVLRLVGSTDAYLRRSLPIQSSRQVAFFEPCRRPVKLLFLAVAVRIMLSFSNLFPSLFNVIGQALSLVFVGGAAWLLIGIANGFGGLVLNYYSIQMADNLSARKIQTTVQFIRKLAIAAIVVLAVVSGLMMFEKVRQIGTGLLASAGVLGIIVGVAAQRSIANLLVGLQMAVSQPVRIDDVVIIENEWGKVEEINATYAVIKIWDERRLIVPLTYFTEKPFQNWTRTNSELLCTVTLFVDYSVHVDSIRTCLNAILSRSAHWDGRVGTVQVTGATERAMELRALMSARDASDAWDLRCEVREQLLTYIQETFADGFPKVRASFEERVSRGPATAADLPEHG